MKSKKNIAHDAVRAAFFCVAALLAGAGCSKPKNPDLETRVKDAYEQARNAVADTWKDLKAYTFEKRSDFSAEAHSLTTKMDEKIRDLRESYSEARASAAHQAAMDDLKKAQADFKAKVEALGHATAETWDSAKREVVESWNRLQAAYDKARAD